MWLQHTRTQCILAGRTTLPLLFSCFQLFAAITVSKSASQSGSALSTSPAGLNDTTRSLQMRWCWRQASCCLGTCDGAERRCRSALQRLRLPGCLVRPVKTLRPTASNCVLHARRLRCRMASHQDVPRNCFCNHLKRSSSSSSSSSSQR